jgi:spore coat polysaccharide biosynthesis predicted glycosyltransferase SpsG
MPGMMRWADVAISAGGSTCWELAFMGLPSLVIVVADNQRGIAAGLAEEGAAVSLGWHADLAPPDIARSVRSLADDAAARRRMTARGRRLVDGCGGDRLVRELLPCA